MRREKKSKKNVHGTHTKQRKEFYKIKLKENVDFST